MKRKITEENDKELLKEWVAEADKVESVDAFIDKLATEYEHDYGTIVHAMFAVMKAAMKKLNNTEQGGITGFQASCLGWLLIQDMFMVGDSPLRLVKYEEMAFPQYRYKFEKTISPEIWKYLQKRAEEGLKSAKDLHPDVAAHFTSILSGVVPFGYMVVDDKTGN